MLISLSIGSLRWLDSLKRRRRRLRNAAKYAAEMGIVGFHKQDDKNIKYQIINTFSSKCF
jgi:hypothetical protein